MESNFSNLYDEIYNQNIYSLKNLKKIYVDYRKREKILTIKKVLISILIVVTFPLFPLCIIWDILLLKYLNDSDVKQYKSDDGDYVNILSDKLIKPLLTRIFGCCNYDMIKGIETAEYNIASNNEEYNWETYSSNNFIEIPINPDGYKIKLSNVFTYHEDSYYDHNDKLQTRTEQIFGGLVGIIDLPFNINAKVVITQNEINDNKIDLDMAEFEKVFNVSTTDEVIARQILTSDVMQRILDMKQKIYKNNFDIVINNNRLYIRFHNKTVFNFDIAKNVDKKQYEDTINTLIFIKKMSEDILSNIVLDSNLA